MYLAIVLSLSGTFPPPLGHRYAGRFELRAPLRSSGAARAFLAFDHRTGRDVELLVIDPECASSGAWSSFAQAVQAATAASISGLVLPQGLSSTTPIPPYCVAEPQLVPGFDRLQHPLGWKDVLGLAERVAEILCQVHSSTGIAHRALMPSRCVGRTPNEVRVLDFGVAEFELARPDDTGYRAPDLQPDPKDPRSDVYSLGVIMFELTAGRLPSARPLPRLRSLVPVPPAVDELLARATAQERAKRHPDVAALRAALRDALGLGSAARPAPEPSGAALQLPVEEPMRIHSAPPDSSSRARPPAAVRGERSEPPSSAPVSSSAPRWAGLPAESPASRSASRLTATPPLPPELGTEPIPMRREAAAPAARTPLPEVPDDRTEVFTTSRRAARSKPKGKEAAIPDRTEVFSQPNVLSMRAIAQSNAAAHPAFTGVPDDRTVQVPRSASRAALPDTTLELPPIPEREPNVAGVATSEGLLASSNTVPNPTTVPLAALDPRAPPILLAPTIGLQQPQVSSRANEGSPRERPPRHTPSISRPPAPPQHLPPDQTDRALKNKLVTTNLFLGVLIVLGLIVLAVLKSR